MAALEEQRTKSCNSRTSTPTFVRAQSTNLIQLCRYFCCCCCFYVLLVGRLVNVVLLSAHPPLPGLVDDYTVMWVGWNGCAPRSILMVGLRPNLAPFVAEFQLNRMLGEWSIPKRRCCEDVYVNYRQREYVTNSVESEMHLL